MSARHRTSIAVTAVCAAVLPIVSACGSSSSGSTSANANSPVVKAAKAAISQHTGKPTFTAGDPIDISSLRGKTVMIIAHDQVADELVGIADGIKQAGSAAGVTVKLYNGDASVSTIQQGFTQAIHQHVGAIIVDGIDPALISSSITAADKAKVPVITVEDSKPDPHAPGQGAGQGIDANVEPPDYKFGQLIADKAIADSGGQVRAAILTFDNPIARAAVDGMKGELAKCHDCKVIATTSIPPQKWPTQVSPQTQAMVRSNPDMNYILAAADTMGIFAVSGIKLTGKASSVKVLGVDGSGPATLALTKDGSVMQADPGSSPAWLGWAALDQAMRAMLKQKPADPTVPYRWIDTKQLAGANPKDLTSVYGNSYVAGYQKQWGLNG